MFGSLTVKSRSFGLEPGFRDSQKTQCEDLRQHLSKIARRKFVIHYHRKIATWINIYLLDTNIHLVCFVMDIVNKQTWTVEVHWILFMFNCLSLHLSAYWHAHFRLHMDMGRWQTYIHIWHIWPSSACFYFGWFVLLVYTAVLQVAACRMLVCVFEFITGNMTVNISLTQTKHRLRSRTCISVGINKSLLVKEWNAGQGVLHMSK